MLLVLVLIATTAYISICGGALFAPALATLALRSRAFLFVGAACLLPTFAGSWVFASSLTALTSIIGLRNDLLYGSELLRSGILILANCLRTVPLCSFLLATAILPDHARCFNYTEGNGLRHSFRFAVSLRQYPLVMMVGCAVVAASSIALDSALPTVLFRGNPGTPPETIELLLFRQYRETYGSAGSRALPAVATLGVAYALSTGLLAACVAYVVTLKLRLAGRLLFRFPSAASVVATVLSGRYSGLLLSLPAILLVVFAMTRRGIALDTSYVATLVIALLVALASTTVAFGTATLLRYNSRTVRTSGRLRHIAIALLFFVAMPSSCYLMVLRLWPQSMGSQSLGYLLMVAALVVQLIPIALFFAISVLLGVERHRVEWIQATRFHSAWLCWTEGHVGQRAGNAAVLGYCFTAVATGTSLLSWFGHLVPSPSEQFLIAVFGRRTNDGMAGLLVVLAFVVGGTASVALAASYYRALSSWKHG